MSDHSKIEWTDSTWNPATGCLPVSPGCDHCYAKRFAERFRGVAGNPFEQGFDVRLWPERLAIPLHWTRPRRIFVGSMTDVFQKEVPEAYIRRIFTSMAETPRHTYQVLTKRSARLAKLAPTLPWPPHIWVGVSVELERYRWRVDHLRQVPAAVRFISAEPLLGPLTQVSLEGIQWVITGGESGPGARPCDPAWVRDLRDRCQSQGIAFFHKQWGGIRPSAGGRMLDGRTWEEFPVVRS